MLAFVISILPDDNLFIKRKVPILAPSFVRSLTGTTVLVALLLPDHHDAEHDRDTEGGGGVQCVEENTVCSPPLFPGLGENGAGETSRTVFVGVQSVSVSRNRHSVWLGTTLGAGAETICTCLHPSFPRSASNVLFAPQRCCRCRLDPSSLGRKQIDNNVLKKVEHIFAKLAEVGASTYAEDVSLGGGVMGFEHCHRATNTDIFFDVFFPNSRQYVAPLGISHETTPHIVSYP